MQCEAKAVRNQCGHFYSWTAIATLALRFARSSIHTPIGMAETNVSDKAERLHALITRADRVSRELTLAHQRSPINAYNAPLWMAFGPLAGELGFHDYGDFRDTFLRLCSAVREEVSTIPLKKDTVRASWLVCLEMISKVFDAENFPHPLSNAFQNHFSNRNLEILDAISERFQAVGLRESTPSELEAALSAVRDVIQEMQASGQLDLRIASVLAHYLQQMEIVFAQVEDFGDDTFWKVYKEVFATFLQLHPIIAGFDNKDTVSSKISVAWQILTEKTFNGAAVGANLVTIGSAALPLLAALTAK